MALEDGKVRLATQKVAELKKEYERWLRVKVHPGSDREGRVASEQCSELEIQFDRWESLTRPADERVAELRTRFSQYRERIDDAFDALRGGSHRRKAEVVRGLVTRIVVHFRRERKARYTRTVIQEDTTSFEINPTDGSSRRSSEKSNYRLLLLLCLECVDEPGQ